VIINRTTPWPDSLQNLDFFIKMVADLTGTSSEPYSKESELSYKLHATLTSHRWSLWSMMLLQNPGVDKSRSHGSLTVRFGFVMHPWGITGERIFVHYILAA